MDPELTVEHFKTKVSPAVLLPDDVIDMVIKMDGVGLGDVIEAVIKIDDVALGIEPKERKFVICMHCNKYL